MAPRAQQEGREGTRRWPLSPPPQQQQQPTGGSGGSLSLSPASLDYLNGASVACRRPRRAAARPRKLLTGRWTCDVRVDRALLDAAKLPLAVAPGSHGLAIVEPRRQASRTVNRGARNDHAWASAPANAAVNCTFATLPISCTLSSVFWRRQTTSSAPSPRRAARRLLAEPPTRNATAPRQWCRQ
jgi:hypothetical protein